MFEVSVHPYGDHTTTSNGGAEVRWENEHGAGFIDVPLGGEVRFPHDDGFSFVMAGNDSRVEAEDGTVLWHCNTLSNDDN